MNSSKIRCIVQNEKLLKKTLFATSFYELTELINAKFSLSTTDKYSILDEDSSEIDSDAFDEYKAAGFDKLELFLKQFNQLQLYDENDNNESFSTNVPTERQSDSLIIEFVLLSFGQNNSFRMEISCKNKLSEVSEMVLAKNGLNKSEFVCFFYASDGQPLSPSYYASQFLMVHQVLINEERVFVIMSNNIYGKQLISITSYARDFNIAVIDMNNNISFNVKVNQSHDKEPEIKDQIGLMAGIPSTSISLQKKSETLYEYSLIDHYPNLNLSSYNPVTSQSEEGLRLFRNFIYCLPSHIEPEVRNRLLACIRYLSPHNPLLYSLNLTLSQYHLTESELIALDEGAIILFQHLAITYNLNFAKGSLFEKTLEFFSLLLELCNIQSFKKGKDEVFDTKNISNPTKIIRPVIVQLNNNEQEIYDFSMIEEFRKSNKKINKFEGSLDSLAVDKNLEVLIKRTVGIDRDELTIMKTVFDNSYDISQLIKIGPKLSSQSDMKTLKSKRLVTQITSYLDLKENSKRKTLTYDLSKKIVVNLGLKECSYDILLKDIFTSNEVSINPVELSVAFNKKKNNAPKSLITEEVYSRIPEEAISILIDTSASMTNFFLQTGKVRIAVTKDLFNSFINRSLGYNLPQVLSLTTFNTTVTKVSKFTENSYKFCEYLESIQAKGDTSIFDAIASAIPDLEAIKQKYNNISLRIICFSDGEDNSSETNEINLLQKLTSNDIILDCINLGSQCIKLKNLSLCSGGFAFLFNTLEEGFKIFESDSFISLKLRNPPELCYSISDSDMNSKTFKNFTTIPPPFKIPKQVALKATNVVSTLITMDIAKPKFDNSTGSLRYKRINREMALIHKNPHPDIKIYPCEADIQFWNGIFSGPVHTPYESGNFHFYISFPEEYPHKAPEIRFMTKIFHINVNSSGRICISILNSDYGPDINILRLLQSIYGLLMNPEDTDSLDTNTASLFRSSRSKYDKIAREWTASFAMKPVSEILKGISSVELQNEIPVEYVCALTKKIMNEPVTCRTSGITYERKVIEDFIRENGYDPITRQQTKLSKLFPETILQGNIKRFLSLNIQ